LNIGVLVVAHALSIEQTAHTANIVEWARLALSSPGAPVLRVTRILCDTADRPLALEMALLPLDSLPGLTPHRGDIPDIVELAERHGLALGRAAERVGIVQATGEVALHLGVIVDADLMKLDRIVETADGEPIEWRVAFRKI
jgi:DNA-binding GntR family transcriptional regulator